MSDDTNEQPVIRRLEHGAADLDTLVDLGMAEEPPVPTEKPPPA
ncbi:hypothetical protein OG875_04665 [Streptomyces sp. NBC_01498]|nr:hypothetical protein [Streptomyces sp. NBC_01498]WTL23948.1 hypothetical protein OG875_04665 [Streptomyces sp. NBC_01498]